MSLSPADIDRLTLLANAVCDEVASEADLAELDALLSANESDRLRYLDCCTMHIALGLELQAGHVVQKTFEKIDIGFARQAFTDSASQTALSPRSFPITSVSPVFGLFGNTAHGAVAYFSSGWPVAYLVAIVIFGVGLLIGSFMPASSRPQQIAGQLLPPVKHHFVPESQREFVGQITGMVDCQWADASTEAFNGAHVALGRKYALASGLMEITYDSGAKVILQGPVEYEVESAAGGFLSAGKLTARVENKEERRAKNEELSASRSSFLIPHSYFAVRTPTAIVTDLGTEFGVQVTKQGNTTAHVFRGSVELHTVAVAGKTESVARVLHQSESARVECGEQGGGSRLIAVDASIAPATFVRKLVRPTIKTFDLVDVVAGGDGFSGKRKGGIDPTTGQATDTSPVPKDNLFWLAGDGQYHRVRGLPFVDGVFIPNGRTGAVQVDSAGHMFTGFSDSDGTTSAYVWAGGAIPAAAPVVVRTEMGGIDYATAGHGLLFMHANKGLTFDLDAIRRANPDHKLLRFRATAGNTERISENGASVYADIWVLVDAQSRFQRRQVSRFNGAFSIAIPIAEKDHFLTLAATDGGNEIAGDWIVFGDPRLELLSTNADSTKNNTGR